MELPHDRGHSGDREGTKCLLPSILNGEVEEGIGGGKAAFWDKRAIKQRLVVDLLGLPGDESAWIIRKGRCCM